MKKYIPEQFVAMVKIGERRLYLSEDGRLTEDRFVAVRFPIKGVPEGYTPIPV